jgi:diguanylate cyclase (GGDEF)-like protein
VDRLGNPFQVRLTRMTEQNASLMTNDTAHSGDTMKKLTAPQEPTRAKQFGDGTAGQLPVDSADSPNEPLTSTNVRLLLDEDGASPVDLSEFYTPHDATQAYVDASVLYQIAIKSSDIRKAARAKRMCAKARHTMGHLEESLACAREAAELSASIDDDLGRAYALVQASRVLSHQQRFIEALDLARPIATGAMANIDPILRLLTRKVIGNSFREMGCYAEAVDVLEHAYELAIDLGASSLLVGIGINLAATLALLADRFDDPYSASRALDLCADVLGKGLPLTLAARLQTANTLALAHVSRGAYADATRELVQGLQAAPTEGMEPLRCELYTTQTLLLTRQQLFAEAVKAGQFAFAMTEGCSFSASREALVRACALAHEGAGNAHEALGCLRQAERYRMARLCLKARRAVRFTMGQIDAQRRTAAVVEQGERFEMFRQINIRLQTKLRESEEIQEQLRKEALTDPLTGTQNRRYLEDMADALLALASRQTMLLSVAIVDIDSFKRINDAFGHAAGDDLLRSFAHLTRNRLRPADTLARVGGDEFVILLPDTQLEAACLKVNHLRDEFQQNALAKSWGHPMPSFSAGVACFPAHGQTIEELLMHADVALYDAKDRGRSCTVAYCPPLGAQAA